MVASDKAQPKEGRRTLRGGGRHTELGDNGFSSGIPSLKSCFETWSQGKDFFFPKVLLSTVISVFLREAHRILESSDCYLNNDIHPAPLHPLS